MTYKLFLFFFTSVLLIFCFSGISGAEKLELTLREAIDISLRENLSLSEERFNTKIAEADIKLREGEFDPAIGLDVSNSYRKSATPSLLIGTEDKTLDANLSLGGKIITGTSYELKWSNERAWNNLGFFTINPYYSSDLTLTITQPLLKDMGAAIQESNINVARNNFEISKLALDDKIVAIVSDTADAYWDLAFARYNVEVAELSLSLAQNLLEEVKARISTGFLAPVEIYKAEAEESLREEALLNAKKTAKDSADRLRTIMNSKDWNMDLLPIEKPPSPFGLGDIEEAIDSALKSRRDYKQAAIDRKNKEILRKYYENQKYPDINLTGAVGLNGLNGTYYDAMDKLGSGNYYEWQVGLSLRIPIGNRSAEGNYLKAKNDEDKSDISFKMLEQKIIAEVRTAWRSVELAIESITATNKTRIASEKRLDAEENKFKVGMAILNDVLKFQEEYAKSLSSEKKAAIDYAKAIVQFERVKGTLGQNMH